ncbi:hypothetical protein [Planctomyces sp. SH-PL14]|uniref:hypothetical protein n=1 Tax=Planctomyces sp. SH-PL14 TaxID=1632864 RepID=UPI00078B9326|nr:hypothetical protein [Planctomyces sp. SH-PL14]AMV22292.1 hypothetical protein VT03_30595 [Planctomyces sp. SH-PL14]
MNRRRWLQSIACLALPTSVTGCTVLSIGKAVQNQTAKPFLPPLIKPKDAVSVDIMLADRAVGDPMIGKALWNNLNEVSVASPASHRLLADNGFQYGLASSTPPFAIQSLLAADSKSATQRIQHLPYGFPSGGEHLVETWPEVPLLECSIPTPDKTSQKRRFETARCVLRIRMEKVEDGWARLEFTPEIHHGPNIERQVPTEHGWMYDRGQEVEGLHELKFAVELNVQEMAVIGLQDRAEHCLGHCFFRGNREGRLERTLMIRLTDIYQVQPVRQFESA